MIREHDPAAATEPLEETFERIRPRIKRLLKSHRIPHQDFEDLVQETLLEALKQWDTIRNVEAWLLGTLRFKCAQYWRRQRGARVQTVDPPTLEGLCEPLPPEQEKEEVLLDLRRLTRGLGRRHRTALWLRFGLGLSTHEVAHRLGYCPASVRKLSNRALTRLHRWATSDPGDDPTP